MSLVQRLGRRLEPDGQRASAKPHEPEGSFFSSRGALHPVALQVRGFKTEQSSRESSAVYFSSTRARSSPALCKQLGARLAYHKLPTSDEAIAAFLDDRA